MATLRTLFWFALFLGSTFAFTVLFEHGPADFQKNSRKEFEYLKEMVGMQPAKKPGQGEKSGGGLR